MTHWKPNRNKEDTSYFKNMSSVLKHLRPNVAYITVSQNADGIQGRVLSKADMKNILVLSGAQPSAILLSVSLRVSIVKLLGVVLPLFCSGAAGGYGHIPIPLLKQPEKLLERPKKMTYLVSFMGVMRNCRDKMKTRVQEWFDAPENKKIADTWKYKVSGNVPRKFTQSMLLLKMACSVPTQKL